MRRFCRPPTAPQTLQAVVPSKTAAAPEQSMSPIECDAHIDMVSHSHFIGRVSKAGLKDRQSATGLQNCSVRFGDTLPGRATGVALRLAIAAHGHVWWLQTRIPMARTCFVVMAIGTQCVGGKVVDAAQLKVTYEKLIRPALLEVDPALEVIRADEVAARQTPRRTAMRGG